MKKNSKIFVAGHGGLVGSTILRRLRSEGYTHLITRSHRELDLTRQADVIAFFEEERPEYVFLAAAKVGGIWANNAYPADFIYTNIMIQSNVIDAAYRADVKKLLFLGSSCIYPRECPQPMKEEYLLSGKLEPTNEPYAIAKIAGIKMCQSYNSQYGTHFVSVMPTNAYGPGDNFDLETSHVLPALIRKFHEAKARSLPAFGGARGDQGQRSEIGDQRSEVRAQRPEVSGKRLEGGEAVTIWGTGTPRREFLYVGDLASACLFVMDHYEGNDIINIGVGQDLSIRELAELIRDITGFEGAIEYDSSKPDGTPRKLLDVSRLELLGWHSETSLRAGIQKTYQWYVNERLKAQG
ncbi:MAG: GDP-L-fucose synthase [Desulfobacterales bacterium]|nr:GDP-L-fucose synthase [Desulfobacterales bacterium]